jgi:hypothetical protein
MLAVFCFYKKVRHAAKQDAKKWVQESLNLSHNLLHKPVFML